MRQNGLKEERRLQIYTLREGALKPSSLQLLQIVTQWGFS